ncbi:DUF3734 domain-containing protein [Rugosibacter aromaticivorans]|uniref:DUF3734 domain-containing protein n=1 Tax=Rugosibacter aromaticivorans TaxID=1565605 RepID=UPI000ABE33BB|nr:patatin-like phospholipase family protein [Rugosibacter aromaticivorans]
MSTEGNGTAAKPRNGNEKSSGNGKNTRLAEYEVVALVLQGGGALGSYQAGIYEGLAEANIQPNWVAGISIGALNAAIIAGNPPEKRVEQLRGFWEAICQHPAFPPTPVDSSLAEIWPPAMREALDVWEASRTLMEGQNGFFAPRLFSWLPPFHGKPDTASFYDTKPMRATLEKFADFERINDVRQMRVSVGAVNVRNGNFAYFDNTKTTLRPEHFIASGALPPGFAAVEIDGEYYWDGGLVSNTPLYHVLTNEAHKDSLIFQVDLWSAQGEAPTDLFEVAIRQKDIQYSSRTRMITEYMESTQKYRRILQELMALVPQSSRDNAWYLRAAKASCDRRFNVIHLIYKDKGEHHAHYMDYQFSPLAMHNHWHTGLDDIRYTLTHREWLDLPPADKPFVTHDMHRRTPTQTRTNLP